MIVLYGTIPDWANVKSYDVASFMYDRIHKYGYGHAYVRGSGLGDMTSLGKAFGSGYGYGYGYGDIAGKGQGGKAGEHI